MQAFIDPIKVAISCLGSAHVTLSRKARSRVGETHGWSLNASSGMKVTAGHTFNASMQFEILDQGASRRDERYRVTTRGYMYSLDDPKGRELVAAHWHPYAISDYQTPHWHFMPTVISEEGAWLSRTHIPSPRISIESMIRFLFERSPVRPACDDWKERLDRTEADFDRYKSWADVPPNV